MNIDNYLEHLKRIHQNLLGFLDNEDTTDENLQSLINDQQIRDDMHTLKLLLHLICKIANHHHRSPTFFEKIESIFNNFQNDIKANFSNREIFNIFKSNKRILLLLIEKNLITFDESIINQITNGKYKEANYPQYFDPEICHFFNKQIENYDDNFNENRKSGENSSFICKLIQKDSVTDFIQYCTQSNYPLSSQIEPSIYETNSFLLKSKNISLIEYSAFFGSIQIFKYLKINGIQLTPSLWIYAIHGNNAEMIHLLEENQIKPEDTTFNQCYYESIKCNHNNLVMYLSDNCLNNEISNKKYSGAFGGKAGYSSEYRMCYQHVDDSFVPIIKNYNFDLLENSDLVKLFQILCKYEYYQFVDLLLKNEDIDINMKLIYQMNYFIIFQIKQYLSYF